MANPVCDVLLTEARLQNAASTAAATVQDVDLAAGAVVDFWGVVRGSQDGRAIEGIDYEAHGAMAEHQMRVIGDEAREKFRLNRIVLHHRIGFVRTGEASLFLQVTAKHRAAAFEASKWIVDALKERVPIWKRPRLRQPSGVASADSPEQAFLRK